MISSLRPWRCAASDFRWIMKIKLMLLPQNNILFIGCGGVWSLMKDKVDVVTPINILFIGDGKFWSLMKIKLMLIPQSTYCSRISSRPPRVRGVRGGRAKRTGELIRSWQRDFDLFSNWLQRDARVLALIPLVRNCWSWALDNTCVPSASTVLHSWSDLCSFCQHFPSISQLGVFSQLQVERWCRSSPTNCSFNWTSWRSIHLGRL